MQQKLVFVTTHMNHPKFDDMPSKHGFIVEEVEEINALTREGWKIVEFKPSAKGGNTTHAYGFVILMEKP
jgi:hypothetical protein